ncbi:MAG: outer membrane protein assembly factor BamD [Gammaproteobacteria bacterium]|nr:outer membrane protein assembly factor BamD [Gammaproteobacteria bacterium]MAW28332.1 outer membrane protein assembly factor BamD [Gammaproteobacteria bacterium]OUU09911.1 MAG: hypothetical protein CBB94_06105 [Gammaproteobacteria bacterium TMED34]
MRKIIYVLIIAGLSAVSACSSQDVDPADVAINSTEGQLYTTAQRSLRTGNYTIAIEQLELLESRFPFGRYAQQAQLELIYAYFRSSQPEAARAAADRFIRLHPQHVNVDYAYYLKAMVSFQKDKNFLESVLPINPARRDISGSREAFDFFDELIEQYPDSKYAPDAQQRMVYLRNLMAEHELEVARYYIKRRAFVAAANRGRNVFEHYQTTPAVPDALALMVEAYLSLEMPDLANESLLVLQKNFPDHPSLDNEGNFRRAAAERERSFLNIMTFGLLG